MSKFSLMMGLAVVGITGFVLTKIPLFLPALVVLLSGYALFLSIYYTKKVQTVETDKEELIIRCHDLARDLEEVENNYDELLTHNHQLIDDSEANVKELEQEKNTLEERIIRTRLTHEKTIEGYEKALKKLEERLVEQTDLQNEITRLQSLDQINAELVQENSQLLFENGHLTVRAEEAERELQVLEKQYDQVSNDYVVLAEQKTQLTAKVDHYTQILEQIATLSAEVKAIDLDESHEVLYEQCDCNGDCTELELEPLPEMNDFLVFNEVPLNYFNDEKK